MDVIRARRRPIAAKLLAPLAGAALISAAAWSTLSLVHPRANEPVVDRTTLVTAVAIRGDLIRSVRAPGTLVPQKIRLASSAAEGTIDTIPIHVGSVVTPETVIATMRNPDLDAAVIDAAAQVTAARAELSSVGEEAKASQLDRRAAIQTAVANLRLTHEEAVTTSDLHAQGLIADTQFRAAQIKADAAGGDVAIASRKLGVDAANARAKSAVAQARVDQLLAALQARRAQQATLIVRAGARGVVQSLTVERGARVTAGTQLARIVDQRDLKATIAVPEAEIRDVVVGLRATVDTQNGIVRGHVVHVDPAAGNGAIAVDVAFDAALPVNARPDQHVDGTIEFERMRNVISIARPAAAADNATLDLYRLVEGGTRAVKTSVRLGRGSLERVEVQSGITAGATVIVSDTSSFNAASALRLQ